MTEANTQAGFTIIEVILFLAISSLLIISAMAAVSGRTDDVQFTDSIRSVESFLESRISRTANGALTNDGQTCSYDESLGYSGSNPNDGSCIFLGYIFDLDEDDTVIETWQTYGRRIASSDECLSDNAGEELFCAEPTLLGLAPVEEYDILWGLEVYHIERTGGTELSRFGYLRSPSSQVIVPVSFDRLADNDVEDPNAYRVGASDSYIADDFDVLICLTNGKKPGAIKLGNQEAQYAVDAIFDDAEDLCPAIP